MIERYRQGFGKQVRRERRVDIGRGRLIVPAKEQSCARESEIRTFANLKLPKQLSLPRLLLGFVFLVAALIILAGCAGQAAAPTPAVKNSIEIESIRLTAAGHYLDMRYRVLDAEHANKVLGPGVKPLLIHEASGSVLAVPMTAKLGSLRQTRGEQRPDRSYFVLFLNSAGLTSGSRVTAEMGDMRIENLIIE